MAQNLPRRGSLQRDAPTAEPSDQAVPPIEAGALQRDALPCQQVSVDTRALIDWRFGVFIHLDTDTYYGPGQISILSQDDAGEYTFRRLAPDERARSCGASATRRSRS